MEEMTQTLQDRSKEKCFQRKLDKIVLGSLVFGLQVKEI